MRKRILSALLTLVLVVSLAPAAVYAASDEAETAANALYQLGLFSGTGTDADGQPIFELDREPMRYEAVTMLVRLLGKDDEAKAGTWNTPFTDVADWAKPYVGYAYTNKLTSGTSVTTFGGTELVTPTQYITFVLRALGYESGTDFQWDKAWELSDRLGFTEGRYNENTANFTRGDVAIISYNALSAKLKGRDTTLIDDLTASDAVKKHTHNYVTKTIEYSKEVLIDTETLNDYAQVTIYGCFACDFTTYDSNKIAEHVDSPSSKCFCARWWIKNTTEVVGTHEEPKYAARWGSELVRVCSICRKKEPEAHTHNYIEKTVPGTGGHYEEVQIQVGTETVNDYAQVTIYGCNACSFTTYDSDEMIRHVDARYAPITSKCWCSTWWWKTTTEVVGTHEEPRYAARTIWVEDSTTIRVCSICGQQEP